LGYDISQTPSDGGLPDTAFEVDHGYGFWSHGWLCLGFAQFFIKT
jgi:hypothetical protein